MRLGRSRKNESYGLGSAGGAEAPRFNIKGSRRILNKAIKIIRQADANIIQIKDESIRRAVLSNFDASAAICTETESIIKQIEDGDIAPDNIKLLLKNIRQLSDFVRSCIGPDIIVLDEGLPR